MQGPALYTTVQGETWTCEMQHGSGDGADRLSGFGNRVAETPGSMVLFARLAMEALGPIPTFADFSTVPESNPWAVAEAVQIAAADASAALTPVLGPQFLTFHFSWGSQEFRRTDDVREGRYMYRSCGHISDDNSFMLSYSNAKGGCWEVATVSTVSSGCLYRKWSDANSPEALVGRQVWEDCSGATTYLAMSAGRVSSDGRYSSAML